MTRDDWLWLLSGFWHGIAFLLFLGAVVWLFTGVLGTGPLR